MSNTSLGFIEITGVVAAVDALDIMCKTSGVELATWERKLGGRLVTIVVKGDVASVTEAVETAAAKAIKKPVAKGNRNRDSTPWPCRDSRYSKRRKRVMERLTGGE